MSFLYNEDCYEEVLGEKFVADSTEGTNLSSARKVDGKPVNISPIMEPVSDITDNVATSQEIPYKNGISKRIHLEKGNLLIGWREWSPYDTTQNYVSSLLKFSMLHTETIRLLVLILTFIAVYMCMYICICM